MSGYSSRTSREHGNSSEACIIPPLYQLVEDVIGSDSPIVGSFKTCPSFTNLKLVSQTPQNDGRTITVAIKTFNKKLEPRYGGTVDVRPNSHCHSICPSVRPLLTSPHDLQCGQNCHCTDYVNSGCSCNRRI